MENFNRHIFERQQKISKSPIKIVVDHRNRTQLIRKEVLAQLSRSE